MVSEAKSKLSVLDEFQKELDAIERKTPMTHNYARVTPEIIKVTEAGVTFDFIIYHYESKVWYGQGNHETALQNIIDSDCIHENERIWDVGCNSGFWSVWFAKLAPRGSVLSFDPFPWNAAATRANAKLNNLRNITVHQVGLGLSNRTVRVHPNTADIYSRVDDGVSLKIVSPQNYLAASAPTFMKIDIEGAEQELAKTEILNTASLEKIYIEMHPQVIVPNGGDPRLFFTQAKKHGFEIHEETLRNSPVDPRTLDVRPASYLLERTRLPQRNFFQAMRHALHFS